VAHLDEDDERRREYDCLRAKPPDEAVMRAASAANAHGFISAMPRGYHTEVGEGGAQLSGGQKQRVAIARAVLQSPVVLLLDEATSSLDRQAETHVQAALDVVSRGRTTLTIAHRLSAIRNADKIFVLRDGAVAESGTHESLSRAHAAGGAPPGSYRALYRGREAESGLYDSDDDESGEGEY
jgi:ABC-type multidrug transport system fused ATPase/permease subunit